jgi:hypothetical protein
MSTSKSTAPVATVPVTTSKTTSVIISSSVTAFVSAIFVLHCDNFVAAVTTSMSTTAMAPTSTVPAAWHLNDLIDGVRVVDVFYFQGHMNYHLLPAKYQPKISIARDIYLTSRLCSTHYLPSSMAPSMASCMNESKENQENYRYQLKIKQEHINISVANT